MLSKIKWRNFIPEMVAILLLILAFGISAVREPKFLDIAYLFDRSTLYTETALLAIILTLVIVAGHIDLSCTAILALVGAIVTTLNVRFGVPFGVCAVLAPLLGGGLGAINGWLVAYKKLPSLVVTLGTMALFRGVAQILLGDHSLPVPESFQHVEKIYIPKTYFHLPLFMILFTAIIAGLALHKTVFGRYIYAIGTNTEAAKYSGVPVPSLLMRLFVLSGAVAGICALTMISRLGVARFDHARGLELDAITAVVLGGTSIFGGRGTIFGTLAAVLLIGVVQTGMGVAGVKSEVQVTVIGVLLLVAMLLANITRKKGK
jgi:rhamnose transport system permease protein